TSCSRSANPNAFSNTVSPLSDTAAAQPGPGATYALVTFSNARSAPATTFSLLGTWAQVPLASIATTAKTNTKFFLLIEFSHLFRLVRTPLACSEGIHLKVEHARGVRTDSHAGFNYASGA